MPYYWRLTGGSLPPGLSLQTINSGREGYLVGNPTQVGVYNWTYTVTDDTPPPYGPLSASNTFSMSISSSLYMRGTLVGEGGALPVATINTLLDPAAYSNRLYAEELGVHNSTFTVSVIQGTKPSWLTIGAGPTTNMTSSTAVFSKYCYAPINFSGTPTAVETQAFTIRVTSTTGSFIDLDVSLVIATAGVIPVSEATSFVLTANKSYVKEGESVVVQLKTHNQPDGSTVPYRITGISAADIAEPLSGNFTLSNVTYRQPIYQYKGPYAPIEVDDPNSGLLGWYEFSYQVGYLTITAISDFSTEGLETMTISLPDQIQQAKPDWVTSLNIDILDTSQSPVQPSYSFFAWDTDRESPISSAIEGNQFYVTLETQNVPYATEYDYVISGISAADLGGINGMTGKFRVDYDGSITKQFFLKPNGIADPKTFIISLPKLGLSVNVDISDSPMTYRLEASALSVTEGDTVVFNLYTTSVPDGTAVRYWIGGPHILSTDIDKPMYGEGFFTVYNNRASVAVKILEDYTVEGTETLTFSADIYAQVQIQIKDKTVEPSYSLILSSAPGGDGVLTASSILTEGDMFYFNVITPTSAIYTNIRYQISGIPQSMINVPLSGTVYVMENWPGFGGGWTILVPTTIPDGGTNNLRTVTVSLPDIGLSGSFQLKSKAPIVPAANSIVSNTTPANTTTVVSTNPLVITSNPAALPNGVVGVNYVGGVNYYFAYTGGVGPLSWSVYSGSLPSGLSCSPSGDGNLFIISGSPTAAGTSTFTIRGVDQNGSSNTLTTSITVTDPAVDDNNLFPGPGGWKEKNPGWWDDWIYDVY